MLLLSCPRVLCQLVVWKFRAVSGKVWSPAQALHPERRIALSDPRELDNRCKGAPYRFIMSIDDAFRTEQYEISVHRLLGTRVFRTVQVNGGGERSLFALRSPCPLPPPVEYVIGSDRPLALFGN